MTQLDDACAATLYKHIYNCKPDHDGIYRLPLGTLEGEAVRSLYSHTFSFLTSWTSFFPNDVCPSDLHIMHHPIAPHITLCEAHLIQNGLRSCLLDRKLPIELSFVWDGWRGDHWFPVNRAELPLSSFS